MISLTRSIGAVAVLATAPEIPPAAKSARNLVADEIIVNIIIYVIRFLYGLIIYL